MSDSETPTDTDHRPTDDRDETTSDADADAETETETERIGAEPIDGDGTYPFAGLTRYDDDVDAVTLPENVWTQQSSMKYWAQNKVGHGFRGRGDDGTERDLDPSVLPERGLHTLVPDLPRATEAEVQWVHPRTGETLKTAKHNAVINPERAEAVSRFGTPAEAFAALGNVTEETAALAIEEMGVESAAQELLTPDARETVADLTLGDDALYYIPTDDYTIINPPAFLNPLCEVLRERDLGDKVFGELRLERDGGRASLDIYMDGQHVECPVFAEDREPVVVGLQVQWDFFGDWAVRACGQALDWACTNAISRLTDREVVKHTGDVESRQDWHEWWNGLLDRLDEKRDQLARIIEAASEEVLDLGDLPNDIEAEFRELDAAPWTALYAYMDLPDYLAEHAGRRLRSEAEDAYAPNWWEIHSAATFAVTHHARGDRGMDGAWDQYARRANDMLMNPAGMEERIVENYERDRDDDQTTLGGEGGGVAEIRAAFEDIREKKERYESWEQEMLDMGVEL